MATNKERRLRILPANETAKETTIELTNEPEVEQTNEPEVESTNKQVDETNNKLSEILNRLELLEIENSTLKNRPTFSEMKEFEKQREEAQNKRNKLFTAKESMQEAINKIYSCSDMFAENQEFSLVLNNGTKQIFRINNNAIVLQIIQNTTKQTESKINELDALIQSIDNKLV